MIRNLENGRWALELSSQSIRHFVKSNCSRDFYRAEFSPRTGKLDILHANVKNFGRYFSRFMLKDSKFSSSLIDNPIYKFWIRVFLYLSDNNFYFSFFLGITTKLKEKRFCFCSKLLGRLRLREIEEVERFRRLWRTKWRS